MKKVFRIKNTMKRPFSFSLGPSLLFTLAGGCAASYQPIEPVTASFDQFQDNLGGGRAEIAWRSQMLDPPLI